LWFDDNPKRTWAQKIAPAARCYKQKFGQPVEVVYIHGDGPGYWNRPDNVRVPVLAGAKPQHHLFLCTAQEQETVADAANGG
jgi:hypothetical protein